MLKNGNERPGSLRFHPLPAPYACYSRIENDSYESGPAMIPLLLPSPCDHRVNCHLMLNRRVEQTILLHVLIIPVWSINLWHE
jgi:hypothetical protein